MAKKRPRKPQPSTKSSGSGRPPARPSAARTPQKRFPVFWVALGAVILIAGIAAIVASAGGSDSENGGSSGAGTDHEYGTVKVTGQALPRLPDGGADPAIGRTIPTVSGENFSGAPVSITPDGTAQMIVFLAHWCPHCNVEAPKLAAYLKAHQGPPQGVELTIVPTGSNAQAPNWPPSEWVRDIGLGSVQALVDDKDGTAAGAFGLTAYPFIVAVDKDGAVVDRRSGEQADDFFTDAFAALANGSAYPGMTGAAIADAIGARLAVLHALDARTHAVQWFEDDRVLADATRLDVATTPHGPLHGLGVTVKDWIDVEGFPCAGTSASQHDRRPTADATVVARLRAAGAVVLAKTKAWDGTSGGPPVAHPLAPDRAPGGSSSGEGVVTATGVSPLGVGSDSGGSVRLPAAWCGAYGLKPTTGLVPTTGHFHRVGPASDGRTQIGFLSTDLDTVEGALTVVAGPDGRDAGVPPVGFAPDATAPPRRFAVLPPDPAFPVDAAVAAAVARGAAHLVDAGLEERPWTWPWLTEARAVTQGYWDRTQLSGLEVARQLWDWDRFRRRFLTCMDDVDVLLSPVAPTVAPRRRAVGAADFVFTLPASLTGSPALSVPAGHDADGLPLAVQLIGRPWEDATVLAAARAVVRT